MKLSCLFGTRFELKDHYKLFPKNTQKVFNNKSVFFLSLDRNILSYGLSILCYILTIWDIRDCVRILYFDLDQFFCLIDSDKGILV